MSETKHIIKAEGNPPLDKGPMLPGLSVQSLHVPPVLGANQDAATTLPNHFSFLSPSICSLGRRLFHLHTVKWGGEPQHHHSRVSFYPPKSAL